MIRLQPAKDLLQHLHGERGIAPRRADLGHQERFFSRPLQPLAEPVLGFAAIVFQQQSTNVTPPSKAR